MFIRTYRNACRNSHVRPQSTAAATTSNIISPRQVNEIFILIWTRMIRRLRLSTRTTFAEQKGERSVLVKETDYHCCLPMTM